MDNITIFSVVVAYLVFGGLAAFVWMCYQRQREGHPPSGEPESRPASEEKNKEETTYENYPPIHNPEDTDENTPSK